MEMLSFRKLNVYQRSMLLVNNVYKLIQKFPVEERYALSDQLRRSIVSVPSNIAEGMGRSSNKEKIHFLDVAFGSLFESYCQIEIAQMLGYISQAELDLISNELQEISKMISGLKKSMTE